MVDQLDIFLHPQILGTIFNVLISYIEENTKLFLQQIQ